MPQGRVILSDERLSITINRLCHQLIEEFIELGNCCIIGIQPRGVPLADRIVESLYHLGVDTLPYGKLDITFYRDDFRRRDKPLSANKTTIDFLIENKNVLLIDDVLYTGRTIQAAMTAIQHYGRARTIQLLALIDRRFNRHLPIKADFVGHRIDALDEAYVSVNWKEQVGTDEVILYPNKEHKNS